jgi:aminotransferase
MINIFQPSLGSEELKRLEDVFASNWIGKGQQVLDFEREFAESLGADPRHFTSTTCCTEGLYLAPHLFDLGPGDEVIVPSISFVAVGSAVISCGAKPVFCDVDPRSLNVRSGDIEKRITPQTRAVYVTHYAGLPCEMDPILDLCGRHDIKVIEDAACTVRSFYKGKACGTLGDMGIWSFDAMKILCAGDGGMIYLRDRKILDAAKEALYLGLPNKQKSGMDSSEAGAANWWEFEVNRPARRAIMNNISGAIAMAQMEKLPDFLARRREIDRRYREELDDLEWLELPPPVPSDCTSSYYLFWVQTDHRDFLARFLKDNGVYTTYRYWPLHKVKLFAEAAGKTPDLPGAEEASRRTLNIPLHQSLTDDDVTKIIKLVKKFRM